jgi:hypothetical protein
LLVVTEEVRGNLAKSLPSVIAAIRKVIGNGNQRFTVIFDRGGYDGQLFEWLVEQGLDFITYQRGEVHLDDHSLYGVSCAGTAREKGSGVPDPPLSIVWRCELDVSTCVALGQQIEVCEQACPDCGQQLGGWGGYWRWIRRPGSERVWIRRCRCSRCRRSHALLPDFCWSDGWTRSRSLVTRWRSASAVVWVCVRWRSRLGIPMTTARD